jgi:metal-dependent amidase/aminoacylase/carboxypeptidase family protein
MTAEYLKRVACTAIDAASADLIRVSNAIWSSPELAFEEHEAHAQLTTLLKLYGFQVDESYTLPTAFRARKA